MRTLAGRIATALAALMVLTMGEARASGVRSPFPVAVRARIDVQILANETSGEWAVTSRSPSDPSRFMADLTAGNAKTGVLYLKGASSWHDADDALGRVQFNLEQGEYFHDFTWADSAKAALRFFGDERRFFTGELGTPLIDDDHASVFEHRLGAHIDAHMKSMRAIYWASGLDNGDERRLNQYGSLRFAPSFGFIALGHTHNDPETGNGWAIAKQKLRHISVTPPPSRHSSRAELLRGRSAYWSDFDNGYYEAMPNNAATFVELRTRRTRIGEDNLFDASYQYGAVGDEYTNDLSPLVPGTVTNRAWVDWAHRRYALDARLAAARVVRSTFDESTRRGIDLTTRARLLNNSELLLRAGARREELVTGKESSGFVHGAYSRELREFMGGIHLLVDDIGEDTNVAAGAEIRLNVNATSAISGRWIVSDHAGGSDALWMRLEFRPTRRAWVTLGYGRENRGDDAYFIEDRDAMPATDSGNVVTLSVRGDL
jgi:hypothetical protein